jgi:hypothetical protein
MAVVESRFDLGPEASELGGLGRGLFLAQSGEAGSSVLAHLGLTTLYDESQQESIKFNRTQHGQQFSTRVNKLQLFKAAPEDLRAPIWR